jgi:hypothetical protein
MGALPGLEYGDSRRSEGAISEPMGALPYCQNGGNMFISFYQTAWCHVENSNLH